MIENKTKDKEFFIKRTPSSENPKIHHAITHILEHSNPKAIAKQYGASVEDEHLIVYVYLAENQNKPSHLEILAKDQNIIKSKLNLNQIKSIANLNSIEKITLPEYAVFHDHITSEGVEFSIADSMHTAGFNGTGIKVGVIDDSFIVSNPEISNNIGNTWSGTGCANIACGITDGASHGTAVAEIVVDMAPGVSLWLYAIQDSVINGIGMEPLVHLIG
jgi:subtilisin family serine protease